MTENAKDHDRVTWWELPVPDLEKGKAFYGAVFGWTFQNFGGSYEMILTSGGDMVGALDGSRETPPGHGVAVYVNVADLEATLARVADNGGTVIDARNEVGGDMGWWAQFDDHAGQRIGLCTSNPAKEDQR